MDTGNVFKPVGSNAQSFRQIAAYNLVEANRRTFDNIAASSTNLIWRFDDIQNALLESQGLRAQLSAIRNSIFWRISGPLRHALEKFRARSPSPDAAALSPPAHIPMTYAKWCETEEPQYYIRLLRSVLGNKPAAWQRLGLVVLADPDSGPVLAAMASALPHGFRLLVLHDPGHIPCVIVPDRDGAEHGVVKCLQTEVGFTPSDAVRLGLMHLDVDLIGFHDTRDRLSPHALTLMAAYAACQPQLDLIFADEDYLGEDGLREAPMLKPGWDPQLQRCGDLIGPFAFYRKSLVAACVQITGAAWRYDLASQTAAATAPQRIAHIPAVLCHRHKAAALNGDALRAAAARQLFREGVDARIVPVAGAADRWRVIYDLPATVPLVSVIICTRDHTALLRTCTAGLLERTDYARLELIIVDNGTEESDALALLQTLEARDNVRVINAPGPFNWSALNNRAAALARGDIILFLNNDTNVRHPDWLTELVGCALQPGVGAVGPMLLYPDGRVQHAGLSTDAGVPRHLFRFAPADDPGICGMLTQARSIWGLTGACIAMRREIFEAIVGLNEALSISCNDIDLCMRLTAHGYRLIWTPWAVLDHHEQATRPSDQIPEHRDRARAEIERLVRDWGNLAIEDPYLNPNLQLVDEHPVLRPFLARFST